MSHLRTNQDLNRVKKMLDNLRKFKKDLLSLEIGDMVWDGETEEWFLVLKTETRRNEDHSIVSCLEVSSNEEVLFATGERHYSFKKGGKVVKGTST